MSEQQHNSGEKENNLKKLLRELPRVKASSDFEQRLTRRLKSRTPPSAAQRLWELIAPHGRIPAPVYSLATIILLVIVAYYAFFRSGSIPKDQNPVDYITVKKEARPSESGRIDTSNERLQPATNEPREISGAAGNESRMKNANAVKPESGEVARSERDLSDAAKPAELKRQEEQRLDQPLPQLADKRKEVQAQQSAEGIPMSRVNKDQERGLVQMAAPSLEKKSDENAPHLNAAPGQQSFTPSPVPQAVSQDLKVIQRSAARGVFRYGVDSVHIRDSIRADSLRKARLDSLKRVRR